MDEEYIENEDETHLLINMGNGKTLGFRGDQVVKKGDVKSAGEGMKMMVRLSGGRKAFVEAPSMIFKNKDSYYPISGVADNVPGAYYRTGPKGWIDRRVMKEWIEETNALPAVRPGRIRNLFIDHCAGHKTTEEPADALMRINTELRYFPPNDTDLLQPAFSFVIQKDPGSLDEAVRGV